jgi:serine/threonine-protein kinase RsbT
VWDELRSPSVLRQASSDALPQQKELSISGETQAVNGLERYFRWSNPSSKKKRHYSDDFHEVLSSTWNLIRWGKTAQVKEHVSALKGEGHIVFPVRVRKSAPYSELENPSNELGDFLRGFNIAGVDSSSLWELSHELCLNIREHSRGGVFVARLIEQKGSEGFEFVAMDRGPGIGDIVQALQNGWSGSGGSGRGLHLLKTVADEFEIRSILGSGTMVSARSFIKF